MDTLWKHTISDKQTTGGCCISPDNSPFTFLFSVYSEICFNVNHRKITKNHIQTLDLVILHVIGCYRYSI